MKYKYLIEYFLHWADVPPDNKVTNKDKFNEVINSKKFGKEYIEYTGKKE